MCVYVPEMRSHWALVIFNRNRIGSSIVFLIRRLTSTRLAFVSFELKKTAKVRERGGGRKVVYVEARGNVRVRERATRE